MGKTEELPSIKSRSKSHHQGLRKLSPDLVSKARDETATQVSRIGLTFLGTAAFCLLSLLSPDSTLLGGSEKIIVPFAGPVSFLGFMLLGPAVLIAVRVYLQIYVEHGDRLDRLARSLPIVRPPTLVPLQNSLIWLLGGLIFYVLLPVATKLFAWKAAVFAAWGLGLFGLAVAVTASHVLLPFPRLSWRSKGMLSIGAAIIAVGLMLGFGPPHRRFHLSRANLSGQWLPQEELRYADLSGANLSGVNLSFAILEHADLTGANLTGAKLAYAHLSFADLSAAILDHADLTSAHLTRAKLDQADLTNANLLRGQLNYASLDHANLRHASLSFAELFGAILYRADLSGATLDHAKLGHANLFGAKLEHTDLYGADLRDTSLSDADLSGADLSGADLSGAFLGNAKLSANLSGADLSGAFTLTQMQLDQACGRDTKLPPGLTLKPCATN